MMPCKGRRIASSREGGVPGEDRGGGLRKGKESESDPSLAGY